MSWARYGRGQHAALLVLALALVVLGVAGCGDSGSVEVRQEGQLPGPSEERGLVGQGTTTTAPSPDQPVLAPSVPESSVPAASVPRAGIPSVPDDGSRARPPTSVLDPGADAAAVSSLGLSGAREACVVAALPEGVDEKAAPVVAVEDAVERCSRAEEFGPAFVEGLRVRYGDRLTEAQVRCLTGAFAALSAEQVDSLLSAGPGGDEAPSVVATMFGSCGVKL